jgi:hypothetical protein
VSALTIRRGLRRHRRDLALIAAIVTLAGLVAAHHGALLEMDHHGAIGAVVELCLGVFTAVGVVLATAGLALVVLKRERAVLTAGAGAVLRVPVARARHGPAVVCVLCVSRR